MIYVQPAKQSGETDRRKYLGTSVCVPKDYERKESVSEGEARRVDSMAAGKK